MISCEEAVERLWDYLERELRDGRRAEIEQHLAFCRRCCGELEFAQELRAFLAQAARPRLPDDVEGRLVAFVNELEHDAAAAGERTVRSPLRSPDRLETRPHEQETT